MKQRLAKICFGIWTIPQLQQRRPATSSATKCAKKTKTRIVLIWPFSNEHASPTTWQQCVRMIPNVDGRLSTKVPPVPPYHGPLRWHPAIPNHSTLQWHHAMAPSNDTTSTPPKLAMAPRPFPQSWSSPHTQWHPTMAPSNGHSTLWWHPRPLAHSTLWWHPAMTPGNGTTSTAPCNGTLVPRPIRQSGSSPSPPFGSKNPYSYGYLGNNINGVSWFP